MGITHPSDRVTPIINELDTVAAGTRKAAQLIAESIDTVLQ